MRIIRRLTVLTAVLGVVTLALGSPAQAVAIK